MGKRLYCYSKKGVRKGEELKAPYYASAAATYNSIITRDIIPNNKYFFILTNIHCPHLEFS